MSSDQLCAETIDKALSEKIGDSVVFKNLPTGQKLLRLGIKQITEEDANKRFATRAIQEQSDKEQLAKVWEGRSPEKYAVKSYRGSYEIYKKRPQLKVWGVISVLIVLIGILLITSSPLVPLGQALVMFTATLCLFLVGCSNVLSPTYVDSVERYRCTVTEVAFEDYIGDVIPDRILENVEVAKKIGLKKFYVWFPMIYNIQKEDPIMVAKLGETYFEIGYWE